MSYPGCNEVDVEAFRVHGYLVVTDAIDPYDVLEVRERSAPILEHKEKLAFDWAWEKGTRREERPFRIVQSSPSLVWNEGADARFRDWMIRFGSTLMRREVELWYDQFLAKPPRAGAET